MSEVYATSLWLHGLFTWVLAALLAWHFWLVFWHAPKGKLHSNLKVNSAETENSVREAGQSREARGSGAASPGRKDGLGSSEESNLKLTDDENVKYRKTRFAYARRLRLFLPAYYAFLGLLFFTGILNLALIKFQLTPRDWGMIALFAPLVVLGALGFSRLKKASASGEWVSFRRFMSVKILCEFAIITLASALGGWF